MVWNYLIDYAAANGVVEVTHKYKHLFFEPQAA